MASIAVIFTVGEAFPSADELPDAGIYAWSGMAGKRNRDSTAIAVGYNRCTDWLFRWGAQRMHPSIEQHRAAIEALCREYGVARLEVFGSAASDVFDPERSDIDFLVSYPPDYDFGPWLARFQDLEGELANLLGRDVDLVMTSALKNRWFAREAAKTRMVIYDASTVPEVA